MAREPFASWLLTAATVAGAFVSVAAVELLLEALLLPDPPTSSAHEREAWAAAMAFQERLTFSILGVLGAAAFVAAGFLRGRPAAPRLALYGAMVTPMVWLWFLPLRDVLVPAAVLLAVWAALAFEVRPSVRALHAVLHTFAALALVQSLLETSPWLATCLALAAAAYPLAWALRDKGPFARTVAAAATAGWGVLVAGVALLDLVARPTPDGGTALALGALFVLVGWLLAHWHVPAAP